MPWILLVVAGLLEVVWAYTMKLSVGFTRPGASAATLLAMAASFALLSISMRTLPLGTAYTVWTGIGAVGSFVIGIAAPGVRQAAAERYCSITVALRFGTNPTLIRDVSFIEATSTTDTSLVTGLAT